MPKTRNKEYSTESNSSAKNVCVTCSTETECENVFHLTFENVLFNKIFKSCMGIQLYDNSNLKYICLVCIETIISFYTFKETALKSYEELSKKKIGKGISKTAENDPICTTEENDQVCTMEENDQVCTVEESDPLENSNNLNHEDNREFISIEGSNVVESIESKSNNELEVETDFKIEFKEESEMTLQPISKINIKDDNLWKCTYCPLTLSKDNPAEIKKHRSWGHTEDILFCCLSCEFKSSSEDEFRKHFLIHEASNYFEIPPRKFGCPKCIYISPRKGDVQRHLLLHQNKGEVQLLYCNDCNFSSRYKLSLQLHIRRRHLNEKLWKPLTKKSTYKCDKCEFKTPHKNSMVSHQLQHKNTLDRETFYCYNCNFKTIHKNNLRPHMNLHRRSEIQTKYICEICGFVTVHRKNYRSHLTTHVNDEEKEKKMKLKQAKMAAIGLFHQCDECSYRTRNYIRLRIHRVIHKAKKEGTPYNCDQCPFSTREKDKLARHMHSINHKDIEDLTFYQCKSCAYKTVYLNALRAHMQRHGEKKFVCKICDFKTYYKTNFVAHQNLHKDPKDVVKFKCQHCEYRSLSKSNIRRHESVHGEHHRKERRKIRKYLPTTER